MHHSEMLGIEEGGGEGEGGEGGKEEGEEYVERRRNGEGVLTCRYW